jgi:hypothetical protein
LRVVAGKLKIIGVKKIWQMDFVVAHAEMLARSFKHFTTRDLFSENLHGAEFAGKIFHAPFVLVSHGTEADPILNFGNAAALALWETNWNGFTRTPSRLTAELPQRDERARLLNQVKTCGFIDDYSGVRISQSGRRFKISRATVWNLIDANGKNCGQAAMFSEWKFL